MKQIALIRAKLSAFDAQESSNVPQSIASNRSNDTALPNELSLKVAVAMFDHDDPSASLPCTSEESGVAKQGINNQKIEVVPTVRAEATEEVAKQKRLATLTKQIEAESLA